MSQETESEVELHVTLRLTTVAYESLSADADRFQLSMDDVVSQLLEMEYVKLDVMERMRRSLARDGITPRQFAEAWEAGQEWLERTKAGDES